MKKIVTIMLAIVLFMGCSVCKADAIVRVIESDDLTFDMLCNRNGDIIIEKVMGTVVDDEGNGKVLNCRNPEYDYISYKCVENANVGDTILTYFVYNPYTDFEDDIILRFDYIID